MDDEAQKGIPDTKKRIFEAALECFAQKGYEGTTMDQVIARAGVSKGSIYWHFASKKELFEQLFEYWFEGVMQSFAQRAELGRSPWEKLQIFIRESFRLLETEARLFQTFIEFFIVGLKDQPFRRRLRHYYRTLTAAATRIIEQGVAEGQFSTPDAEKTAISIFSLLDGLLLRFVLEPECASPRFEDFVVAFVARSVGYTE